MGLLSIGKALRALPQTIPLLRYILYDVTQEQAMNSWDDDWNVVFMVCHLRDLEAAYLERVHLMLKEDNPTFPGNDQRAMAIERGYAQTDLRTAQAEFESLRREFINVVKPLDEDQWQRRGQHPYFGETTILTQAVNNALHDLNHIEQISRALGKTEIWA